MPKTQRPNCVLFTLALLFAASAAGAASLFAEVPLAPNGDMLDSSRAGALPLTSSSLLVAAEGPDGSQGTADDVVLLVQDLGATNTVTPLATPFLGSYGEIVRLSPTRAVTLGYGPDGSGQTADDVLLLLDRLGSDNVVTSITVGAAYEGHSSGPFAIGASAAGVASAGADNSYGTADDVLVVVSDLGGTNTVTPFPAPGLNSSGTRPSPIDGGVLIASQGPDFSEGSADDVVYSFRDLLGAGTRTDVATPFLSDYAQPMPLSPTSFAVNSNGPDGSDSSADDQLHLVVGLDGTPAVSTVPTPYLDDYAAGRPVPFGPDTVVVRGFGADGSDQSADDVLFVVTDIGATNTVDEVIMGPCEEDRECLMQVMRSGTGVVANFGFDESSGSADDGVTIFLGAGTSNAPLYLPLGSLTGRVASQPSPIASNAFMIATGGPDDSFGSGSDDEYAIVSLGDTFSVEYFPVGGVFSTSTGRQFVAAPLGEGRAAHLSPGPDDSGGSGNDDTLRVVGELPADESIAVSNLKISAGSKGEKLKVSMTMPEDLLPLLGTADLTVHVGSVSQTIPASAFSVKKNSISFKDKNAVIQSVKASLKKGTLSVKGKGTGTGLDTTDPGYVPVGIEIDGVYQAVGVAGSATKNGVSYKAPKS